MGIDWKDLLRRYINHVGAMEGLTYISHLSGHPDFTEAEIVALQDLDGEYKEGERR